MVTMVGRFLLVVALVAAACANDVAGPGGPRIQLATDSIDFGTLHDVIATDLHNPGKSPLEWQVQGAPAWLVVQPTSGTLEPGGTQTVELGVLRDVASLGASMANVVVASNVFTGPVGFTVRVEVLPTPALEVVSIGAIEYPRTGTVITIRSYGRGPVQFEASAGAAWAEVVPDVGSLNDAHTLDLLVRVNRAHVPRDTMVNVTIASDGLTEPVTVSIPVAGNPPARHLGADITYAEFINTDLFYSADGASYRLDFQTGALTQLQGVPAMEEVVRHPVNGRFAIRYGSQVSVFEADGTAPFNTVDIGEPLAGMTYLRSGAVAVIPASASEGRVIGIDPNSGVMTVHVTDLPPFRYVLRFSHHVLVTTSDGLYQLHLAGDPVVAPEYGGTGLVFNGDDTRAWQAGYFLTSAGQVFSANVGGGLTILGNIVNEAGLAVNAISSAAALWYNRIIATGHVEGEGWRVREGVLHPSDLRVNSIELSPVSWNGADYEAVPRLATWWDELVVLEEVIAGPATGQWFLSRSWYW